MCTQDYIAAPDPRGIGILFDEYGGAAFALAYRLLGERGLAEEVVQEAFLSIWRHGAAYDAERGSARTWVLTIVHHRAVDQIRSMQTKTRRDTAMDEAIPLPAKEDTWAAVAQHLERERVQRALMTLPIEQREVIELSYYGGFTHAQIAQHLDIPLGTVKGRMRLALDKLRDLLVPEPHDEATGQIG